MTKRFHLTLNRAIADEASLLDDLKEAPKSRRQQRIRFLLERGMKSQNVGRRLGDPFAPSIEGDTRTPLMIHLQPDIVDDRKVLDALDEVAPSRKTRWLTDVLIRGLLLRMPDIDLSEAEDQRAAPTPVSKRIESRHEAELPEVSAEDVGDVSAPAIQDGSEMPKLPFLKGLFE
jgi:hypothetical protein